MKCFRNVCQKEGGIFQHINGQYYCLECAFLIEKENSERLITGISRDMIKEKNKIFELLKLKIVNYIENANENL